MQNKAENVSPVDEINWADYEAALGADVVGPMKVRPTSIILCYVERNRSLHDIKTKPNLE